jgi:hypothetical protein
MDRGSPDGHRDHPDRLPGAMATRLGGRRTWRIIRCGIRADAPLLHHAYAYAPTPFYVKQLQVAYPQAKVLPSSPRSGDIVGELLAPDAPRLARAKDRLSGYSVEFTLGFAPIHIASPMKTAIELDDDAIWVKHWARGAPPATR